MIVPTVENLNLLSLCVIVPSLVYAFVTQLWNLPLRNGRAFFLGVEVSQGFYDGPDARWLARYHAVLVTVFAVDFGVLASILAARRLD